MMDSADTIFSLAEELPSADRIRDEGEDRAKLQPGSLGRGSLREICFVRRISPLGAVLSMESPPSRGARLDLELLTGDRLSGVIAWVQGREAGLRFDEPADMFGLIASNLVRQPGDGRRMPRIELEAPAWLEAGSRSEIATLEDLSDGGARIETRLRLVPHEQIVLTLDGFRPAPAIVRWVRGRTAGIAFVPELPWQELMPWLRRAARPKAADSGREASIAPVRAAGPPTPEAAGGIALNLAARVRDGSRRWSIDVESIDTRQVRFVTYATFDPGRLFWITLPGLEGWPARVVEVDGYMVTCAFTQPLHPAVLERVLAAARKD